MATKLIVLMITVNLMVIWPQTQQYVSLLSISCSIGYEVNIQFTHRKNKAIWLYIKHIFCVPESQGSILESRSNDFRILCSRFGTYLIANQEIMTMEVWLNLGFLSLGVLRIDPRVSDQRFSNSSWLTLAFEEYQKLFYYQP